MRNAIVLGTVLVSSVAACSQKDASAPESAPSTTASSQPATTPPPVTGASSTQHHVTLMPGQGADVAGALDLAMSDGAIVMTGLVTGLKPGSVHGFHVHEKGDCSSPDFKSAGDHFNPTLQQHGDPGSPPHHVGDIPNLEADADGKAAVNARIEGATLGDRGPGDLTGRAVVVHADRDDYKTQPSGNSGDRIACGVIQ